MKQPLQEHAETLANLLESLKREKEFVKMITDRCDQQEADYNFYLLQYQTAVQRKVKSFDRSKFLK